MVHMIKFKYSERNAQSFIDDITRKARVLGLDPGKIYEIFLTLISKNVLRGRSYKDIEITAFLIYIKQNDIPITAKKLVEVFDYDNLSYLKSNYKTAVKLLGIDIPKPSIERRIHYLVSTLGLSKELEDEALRLLRGRPELFIDKNPNGAAAALVWLLAKKYGYNVTQKRVADVIGISSSVLVQSAKELRQYVGITEEAKQKS